LDQIPKVESGYVGRCALGVNWHKI